jgi:hypothetical protein
VQCPAAILAFVVAVLAVLIITGAADASIIVSYTFDGDTKNPASTAANVTASILDSADGSTTFAAGNPSSGKSIADGGWKDQGNYYHFTVTPGDGFELIMDSLTFDDLKDPSGATSWRISYRVGSLGSFTDDGSGSVHTSFGTTPMNTVDLSGISALQNVTESTTFRIRATGASTNAKKWYLDNVTVHGEAVPEPATIGLLLSGGLALLRRRMRAKR